MLTELYHRLANGFTTHDGFVDGKFLDLWEQNGITVDQLNDPTTEAGKVFQVVVRILESMEENP